VLEAELARLLVFSSFSLCDGCPLTIELAYDTVGDEYCAKRWARKAQRAN
jgi:hypothetical protein